MPEAMKKNLQNRLDAEQIYRKSQAQAKLARAARLKKRHDSIYYHGDLVCYRRRGKTNMKAKWYGPGRVFGTETREVDGVRKPGSVIWIVAAGRMKKE